MQGVTLSKAVRQNLQAMQSTAKMMSETQNHLATGKKVNSALDNPTNFFTASALDSRASDLGNLMDSVGNAVQTLQAADNGVKAITKLVESAQGTARQALQATKQVTASVATSTGADLDVAGINGVPTTDAGITGGFVVTHGDGTNPNTTDTIETAGKSLNAIAAEIDALDDVDAAVTQDAATGTYRIEIEGTGVADVFSVAEDTGDGAAAALGITKAATDVADQNGTYIDMNIDGTSATDVAGLTGAQTLTFDVDGTTTSLSLTGTESLDDIAALVSGVDGLTGSVEAGANAGEFKLKVTADDTVTTFTGGGTAASTVGVDGVEDVAATFTPNETRKNLESEYNDLLKQIDQLTSDASFNGNNFLNGDDLKVTFNEDSSSSLTIKGVDSSSKGLGLEQETALNFQDNTKIEATLKKLDTSMETLRSTSSKFGSNLSVVQTRQDFTENMINTLEEGASNLTMADLNQEGANMLALQTRQSLATTAMSMASRADQSVLSLLR